MHISIRLINRDDINDILRIQEECFTLVAPESEEVIKSKLYHGKESSWITLINGEAVGYTISHPWNSYSVPPLNRVIDRIPKNADLLYLQDLGVSPKHQGKGVAILLAHYVAIYAKLKSINTISLIAVQGSEQFWGKLSFKTQTITEPNILEKLKLFGEGSSYMLKKNTGATSP